MSSLRLRQGASLFLFSVALAIITPRLAHASGCIACPTSKGAFSITGMTLPVEKPSPPSDIRLMLRTSPWNGSKVKNITEKPTPVHQRLPRSVAPEPSVPAPVTYVTGGFGKWDCIAKYESDYNWRYQGRYEGGLQFLHSTWVSAGGRRYAEHAYQATPAQQVAIAEAWLRRTSWSQWPQTSRRCGYR